MLKFARIENNMVVEIIEADSIEGKYYPSLVWVELPTNLKDIVSCGWGYLDSIFTAPIPVVIPIPPKTDIELLQEQLNATQDQLNETQAFSLQTSTDLQGLMDYLVPN